ncbi:MAG: hypothetical protein ACP5XB_24230 [Isosphaeraceae bacterium]
MKARNTGKTIDQLFKEFLADQENRLSAKTYSKYEGIIDLYRSYLESYWPDHNGEDEYERITGAGGTYCGTFGAEDISAGFIDFLEYFMPRKVIGGSGTMKAAGTVIKKLSKWLVSKGHAEADESMTEMIGESARDLPATQKLLDRLEDWIADCGEIPTANLVEDHFVISRVGPKQIWLEPVLTGKEIGPIPVPASIAKACKVGWDIGGAVARTPKGWRFVEVWNLSP